VDGVVPTQSIKGFAPVSQRRLLGVIANRPHQPDQGFVQQSGYELAVVEFDDQGRCHQRGQMDKVADRLDMIREQGGDVILLAFVHGWKHDARSDDPNLLSFCWILERTSEHERSTASGTPRKVMGVFVGWRGLSVHGFAGIADDSTFWGRQEAARRVATGSIRELFGRMRHYRNSRVKHKGSPLLVVAGHSFGGMILFSALAQSLIECASSPTQNIAPSFADLVLLINPAIEGARYLPIYDLLTSAHVKLHTGNQLPVFVCVQAANDQPVGTWFPVGNFKDRLLEAAIGDLEKRCMTHAIGFIEEFQTHRVSGPAFPFPFVLEPRAKRQANPFWVAVADQEVVDGHSGIWKKPFISFLAALIFKHANVSCSRKSAEPGQDPLPEENREPLESEEDLATFAQSIFAQMNATH